MASIYKRLSSNNEPGGQIAANVNVISSVLPFGASTAANQVTEINLLTSIDAEAAAANTTLLSIDSHVDGVEALLTDINNKLGIYPQTFSYNAISSVPSSTPTTVITYTASVIAKLKQIDVSGTNTAKYSVFINAAPIDLAYTYFGGSLNYTFSYSLGYPLDVGDIVTVVVEHFRPYLGDFNSKLIVEAGS